MSCARMRGSVTLTATFFPSLLGFEGVHGSSNDCAAVGLGPMGSRCMFIMRRGWVGADGGWPSARLAPRPSATKLRNFGHVTCGVYYEPGLQG